MMDRRSFLKKAGYGAAALQAMPALLSIHSCHHGAPPNILFALADDWSWPHASIAYEKGIRGSDPVVQTPAFDRVAREGVLFLNAFCSAPTCSPSRSSLLTGRYMWQLESAANLRGALPKKFITYPELLMDSGYHVGSMDKAWAPGPLGERSVNPAGPLYPTFEDFMEQRPQGRPFCFFFGSWDAHRPYEEGSGVRSGMKWENVYVPPCLPDAPVVSKDLCDYYDDVRRFDSAAGRMIQLLESRGELENTLIVLSGDNGLPFPRCKVELYDSGTHIPLAIRWGHRIRRGRVVEDFVNLAELGPTFVQAAGVRVPATMTAPDLVDIVCSGKNGQVDQKRNKVLTGREYHDFNCRQDDTGYPMRALRTREYLYIRNFAPERYPAGDPVEYRKDRGVFGEIDPSPTKAYLIQHRSEYGTLYDLAFSKRPQEELYDLRKDPDQLLNVASDPEYAEKKNEMASWLMTELTLSGDPRALNTAHQFK